MQTHSFSVKGPLVVVEEGKLKIQMSTLNFYFSPIHWSIYLFIVEPYLQKCTTYEGSMPDLSRDYSIGACAEIRTSYQ